MDWKMNSKYHTYRMCGLQGIIPCLQGNSGNQWEAQICEMEGSKSLKYLLLKFCVLVTAETHNFHDAERQTKAKIHRNLVQSSCYKMTTASAKAKWHLDLSNEGMRNKIKLNWGLQPLTLNMEFYLSHTSYLPFCSKAPRAALMELRADMSVLLESQSQAFQKKGEYGNNKNAKAHWTMAEGMSTIYTQVYISEVAQAESLGIFDDSRMKRETE
ncbi:hypothetical protein DUI87_17174 [Hirundo rustica rustica]|uniref:Uncharacterized protein n=1 Tax=Hirundo rustica rustica TaxID=333673 RepID=A0A3M0KKF4_HIRRU|nr:hypothetical protein DUI87_17174 [Hirundo rustica rustica]